MSEENPAEDYEQSNNQEEGEDTTASHPQLSESAYAKQLEEQAQAEAAAAEAAAIAAIPINPLTPDLISKSLSLIGRTANGLSFAFTRLNVAGKGLSSLEGLEKFPHVRYVDASQNSLLNVDSLSSLEYLLSVDLRENQLRTLPASLDKKKYLQHVNLAKNHLKELKISSWPLLTWLNVNGNPLVAGLATLEGAGFPELVHLEARETRLKDIGKWNCPKLQRLFLAGNEISELTNLDKKPDLQLLHLRNNKITSLSALSTFGPALTSLTYLNLRGNLISTLEEVDSLKSLPKLKIVVLLENPVDQVEGYRVEVVSRLIKLERLDKEIVTPEEREEAHAMLSLNHPEEPEEA